MESRVLPLGLNEVELRIGDARSGRIIFARGTTGIAQEVIEWRSVVFLGVVDNIDWV